MVFPTVPYDARNRLWSGYARRVVAVAVDTAGDFKPPSVAGPLASTTTVVASSEQPSRLHRAVLFPGCYRVCANSS